MFIRTSRFEFFSGILPPALRDWRALRFFDGLELHIGRVLMIFSRRR